MRDSCLACARKHVSEAEILMREAQMGYCMHAWLAVGHLSQAEAELLHEYPEMAHVIRTERLNLIDGLEYTVEKINDETVLSLMAKYQIDTIELLKQLTMIDLGK